MRIIIALIAVGSLLISGCGADGSVGATAAGSSVSAAVLDQADVVDVSSGQADDTDQAPRQRPTGPKCGDGMVEGPEECEPGTWKNKSCQTMGFGSGTLRCGADCGYDISECKGQCLRDDGVSTPPKFYVFQQ